MNKGYILTTAIGDHPPPAIAEKMEEERKDDSAGEDENMGDGDVKELEKINMSD